METKKTFFSVLLIVILLCNKPLASTAADTIYSGESLIGDETITSKNNNFVMGLLKTGKSKNLYLGISHIPSKTIVWVANREMPIVDEDGYLYSEIKLLPNGNLVLSDPSGYRMWSTNTSSNTLNATEAVLCDDGNLVLRDKRIPSVVIWQSFDHPTDTLLPGAKIGFNKKTNETRVLTSWRNMEDASAGTFRLELDPSESNLHLIIRGMNSTPVWTSREWNEEAKTITSVNFSYISNENESYLTYNLYNSSYFSGFFMGISGQIQQLTWSDTTEEWSSVWSQPKQLCDVNGICGPFGNCNQDNKCECLPGFVVRSPLNWSLQDTTGGCVRNASLQCRGKDVFTPIPTSKLPDNPKSRQVNSMEECKSACQSTCDCNAYAYGKNGCKLWEGDMFNTKQKLHGKAGNLYLRLAGRTKVRKRNAIIWKIVIPLIVSMAAIIMCIIGYMCLCTRNKAIERGRSKGLHGVLTDLLKTKATHNNTPNHEGEERDLQIFSLSCLATATNNFCLKNKLGQGGFGPVYKGELQNGQQIAVKRLSKSSGQGMEEFKNEVLLISKLQHRNLVKLLGCCVEGEEKMLIYEYMPNKSLDAFLFDPKNKASLDWDKRFNIIGGTARGLLYLHRDSRLRVIHRDLKVSNILLDEDMIPRISDFGMARIFGGNQTVDNTSRVVGTMGYMSPEYMMGGTFSEKSDVFSFGVLVLEIVSGKRNHSFYDQDLNLLLHAWRLWNEDKWVEIIDEDLGDMSSPSQVMKCVHIGLLCVQSRTEDRPTMAEVDFMLNYETDRPSPKEPPYTFTASSDESGIPPVHCSNNNVTVTTIGGR